MKAILLFLFFSIIMIIWFIIHIFTIFDIYKKKYDKEYKNIFEKIKNPDIFKKLQNAYENPRIAINEHIDISYLKTQADILKLTINEINEKIKKESEEKNISELKNMIEKVKNNIIIKKKELSDAKQKYDNSISPYLIKKD